MIIFCSSLDVS